MEKDEVNKEWLKVFNTLTEPQKQYLMKNSQQSI